MTENNSNLDKRQEIQEVQYEFPYHYIPEFGADGKFSQTRHWSWGYRYLGGMRVIFDLLDQFQFQSLADIGCGDGRFLREVRKTHPKVKTMGIDYSERAINMATAMNPDITYECLDITEQKLDDQFDAVTLIEVLEHIPPDDVPELIKNVAEVLDDDGKLFITVPHTNKSVRNKHYQHFNEKKLSKIFGGEFDTLDFIPFDKQSRILHLLQKLLGGRGSHYVITNQTIKSKFWRIYTSRYLYTTESECGRIAMVAKKI